MITDIEKFIVHPDDQVSDVLDCINASAEGIAILVDSEGHFVRTVTDGDIRRLLLRERSLDITISSLGTSDSVTCQVDATVQQVLEIMDQYQIDHVPVLDKELHPVGLHVRREVDRVIFLSTPHIGDIEHEFVMEAFADNWIAPLGPNVDAFERELADYVGVADAAATNSGTAALHLALVLLGVSTGDTVFCSSFTFIATANPIIYQGGRPVFIDSEPESWNMSPVALERALHAADREGKIPKAVIVANIYGQSADYDRILAICNEWSIPVIEDAAESLGATYKGKKSGSLGTIGAFSFNGNKIITTSGGGMIVSNNEKLVQRARFLSTQASEPKPYYEHHVAGYNYRMSNVLAGIGRGQLRVLDSRVDSRRKIFDTYRRDLSDLPIKWMPEPESCYSTRWLSVFTTESESTDVTPENIIKFLQRNNIEARRTWLPMHRQPLFKGCEYYSHDDRSISDSLFEHGVCLPSGSNMTADQLDRVIESVKAIFDK